MGEKSYRTAPADALRIEALGELTAIFDRRSMQTHLVVAPMPEILAAMDEGINTAATIAGRLAADFELEAEGEAVPVIIERLAELAAMGLVAEA